MLYHQLVNKALYFNHVVKYISVQEKKYLDVCRFWESCSERTSSC